MCKGPEARDPGVKGQEASVAGREREEGGGGRGGGGWWARRHVLTQPQGGVWILFSVHSRAMDLIKTSVLLWGQLM